MAPPNVSDAAASTPLDATPPEVDNGIPNHNQPVLVPQRATIPNHDDVPTINVSLDQEDRDVWARSEGYTPLADFQGSSMMMMMMAAPPSTSLDDEEEEQVHGGGGAFFVDLTAFGSAAAVATTQEDDNDDDDEGDGDNEVNQYQERKTEYYRDPENNESNPNYRTVADRALSMLDDEYSRTLCASEGQPAAQARHETNDTIGTDPLPTDVVSMSLFIEQHDVGKADSQVTHFSPQSENSIHLTAPLSEKVIPPIDTDAVRRAVQAISLRAPSLVENMSKWQERLEQKPMSKGVVAPPVHDIIPKVPLQAFRKRTAKATQATANLTRSATLAEGLYRIVWKKSATTTTTTAITEGEKASSSALEKLIVHVVGVDHVECASPEHTRTSFGPFVRWLGASPLAPRHVELHLVGPNIPTDAISETATTSVNLMPATLPQRSNLQSAVATYHQAKYHDWWPIHYEKTGSDAPHLIVCFNAGIWGYDEWRPTLQLLCKLPQSVPFIATAYTIQEAEDDWDVIRDVLVANNAEEDNVEHRCLWNIEANAFASKVPRPTATAASGREYRENAAWQAWRLGRMTTSPN